MYDVLSLNISTEKTSKHLFSTLPCPHAPFSKHRILRYHQLISNSYRCFQLKLDKSIGTHKRLWFKNLVFVCQILPSTGMCSFPVASVTNHHNSVAWNNTKVLSYSSRGQESDTGLAGTKPKSQQGCAPSGGCRRQGFFAFSSSQRPPTLHRLGTLPPSSQPTTASWVLQTLHLPTLSSSTFKDWWWD